MFIENTIKNLEKSDLEKEEQNNLYSDYKKYENI